MLTYTTSRVLTVLHSGIVANGVAPSQREIASSAGMQLSAVNDALRTLETRGFIRRIPGKARAIEVLKLPPSMGGKCPTCGRGGEA